MRIIPVMDLLNGLAVHAVRGERAQYQPMNCSYSRDGDPLGLAFSFRDRLDCTELYVADLDAIQKQGQNLEIIAKIADRTGLHILLDAGVSTLSGVEAVLTCGASKVIIGSETLQDWSSLSEIRQALSPERLTFSLDIRSGLVLSTCPELAGVEPLAILQRLVDAGWNEAILLDLARVGAQSGPEWPLIAEAHRRFPQIQLIAGGGVRHARDLAELSRCGASGVLLATALHTGAIAPEDIRRLASGSAE